MARRIRNTDDQTIAFLDLGTHSLRLLVVRIAANQSYQILTQQKEPVRLGEGVFTTQRLRPEAMERAVAVSRTFVEMARSLGATEVTAVATAATREARNREAFIARFQAGVGIPLRVIPPLEEARLVYLGVSSGAHIQQRRALFMDVGGGSTELCVGDQREYAFLDSLPLGAIRVTAAFLAGHSGPVPPARFAEIREYVRTLAVRVVQRVREHPFEIAFGSAGTIETLAQVAARVVRKREPRRPLTLTAADLVIVTRHLCGLSLAERAAVPGLNPERADIIIAGSAILGVLMEELGIRRIIASDRGLLAGLLMDYLQRFVYPPEVAGMSVRARSVMQLGRHFDFDERHATQVATLAGQLFDSASAAGLHPLGDAERELLTCAGHLHDIGMFLSITDHHAHSYYFIRHANLLGFTEQEVALIAALVYYHRQAPRPRQEAFAALDPATREVVRVLSTFLRLAEALDRSHAGLVQQARIVPDGAGAFRLILTAPSGCALELVSAQNHAGGFHETFGQTLAVEGGVGE
jgi:exopolyphosphatase / guanosine-5'-triphosphate,3'-diphosphate pyrophosphatase